MRCMIFRYHILTSSSQRVFFIKIKEFVIINDQETLHTQLIDSSYRAAPLTSVPLLF